MSTPGIIAFRNSSKRWTGTVVHYDSGPDVLGLRLLTSVRRMRGKLADVRAHTQNEFGWKDYDTSAFEKGSEYGEVFSGDPRRFYGAQWLFLFDEEAATLEVLLIKEKGLALYDTVQFDERGRAASPPNWSACAEWAADTEQHPENVSFGQRPPKRRFEATGDETLDRLLTLWKKGAELTLQEIEGMTAVRTQIGEGTELTVLKPDQIEILREAGPSL